MVAAAQYTVARREAEERDFLAAHPDFDPAGTFPSMRRREYGRLDATGHVYLDYTGGGLHATSQVDAHAQLLREHVLGNPHSAQPDLTGVDRAGGAHPADGPRLLQRPGGRIPLHLHRQRQRRAQAGRRVLSVRTRRHVCPHLRQPQLGERDPRVRRRAGERTSSTCPCARRTFASTTTPCAECCSRLTRHGRTCWRSPRSPTSPVCNIRSTSWPRRRPADGTSWSTRRRSPRPTASTWRRFGPTSPASRSTR